MNFLSTILSLLSLSLYSVEVDHFSRYYAYPNDSRQELNRSFNERISLLLGQTEGCEERELYEVLRRHFHTEIFGRWIRELVSEELPLDGVSLSSEQSIYREFRRIKFFEFIGFPLAKIIRIGHVYLGIDKLEHFLGSGFIYFERHHLRELPLYRALMYGWNNEYGMTGLWITGVISYADMLANFNGMRLWNHLLQKQEDVLGQNLGPYIACQDRRWVQVKELDWGDYIDHGLDESINCSRFSSRILLEKVQRELIARHLSCPMRWEVIPPLQEKYGRFAPYLINHHGFNSLDDPEKEALYSPPPVGL